MIKTNHTLIILILAINLVACGNSSKKDTSKANNLQQEQNTVTPLFSADSAYYHIKSQVDFGPRVPNSKAHEACSNFLEQKLIQYGAKVYRQDFEAIAYDGTILQAKNLIGSYNPLSKKRILLCAHWDTRPWADNDPNKLNHHTPILGANDGASGVGVLLEVARQLQKQTPTLGIDIIFFDAEDYGPPQFYEGEHREDQWCLGSQHWSRFPHKPNYNARFGILLDMVGGHNATFYKEGYSVYFAKNITKKIWTAAQKIGFGQYFINQDGGAVIDDHLFINKITNIKTVDIIPYYPTHQNSSFGDTWHTVNDNMDNISKETLQAVGQTVLEVIYNEK